MMAVQAGIYEIMKIEIDKIWWKEHKKYIQDWAIENCGNTISTETYSKNDDPVKFFLVMNDIDAMAFKLRWL